MFTQNPSKAILFFGCTTLALGILALGASMGISWNSASSSPKTHAQNVQEMLLNADTATRGKNMSLATGQISGDVEGLFVLDHLSGNLSCIVLSPRNGQAGGSLFVTNVNRDLGSGKAGQNDYLMTTGYINAGRGGRVGQNRPANCVVYVADGNTGQVAAYSLQYNQTLIDSGRGQAGNLVRIWSGASRENTVRRDQN